MFLTHSSPVDHIPQASWRRPARLLTLAILAATALLTGCGGRGDKEDSVVIARVGDKEITAGYYEDRLRKLERVELPRDETGKIMDMSLPEGKREFVETLINKEVMSLSARRLGYDKDADYLNARRTIISYEAGNRLRAEAVDEPARTLSDEEVARFYDRWGTTRSCRYVITNFLKDAEAAREMALAGGDWDDIVMRYHDGDPAPGGKYEITVPFGRYNALFENGVYDTEIGGITQPLPTDYGFWVMKVDSETPGSKPALAEIRDRIIEITWRRKKAQLMEDFKEGVRQKNKMFIDDAALWKVYEALPKNEQIFYPGTQDPVKREDLKPLNVATQDLDMPLYGYERDGEKLSWTIGDFKTTFDQMNVFERAKRSEMLGGLRQKILKVLDLALLDFEAQDRGYYDLPDVVEGAEIELEEMLVERLYSETVTYDETVTYEQLQAYFDGHEDEFRMPELRSGLIVTCKGPKVAAEAHAMALAGKPWSEVLDRFEIDAKNKERSGRLDQVSILSRGPARDALFALEPGQVSEPFAGEGDRWAIVKLETIEPEHVRTFDEARENVSARIRGIREEEAFQALLAEWKSDLVIEVYDDKLAQLKSWEELTRVASATDTPPAGQGGN